MNFSAFPGFNPYSLPTPIRNNVDGPIDLSTKAISMDVNFLYPPQQKSPPSFVPRESSVCMSPKSISDLSDSDLSDRLRDVSTAQNPEVRIPRPFKIYTKDPIALTLGTSLVQTTSEKAYEEFKEKMLARVKSDTGTNKNMRRNNQTQNPQNEDPSYREKRRKNNEAAKRSRDARKAKEDEIAIRCAFLEQENLQLKMRVSAAERENLRLQQLLSNLKVNS